MDDHRHDAADLAPWLALAEEAARRHRQGRVLAVDPALVLRGLPAMWRPATAEAGPADDVVALAGAALSHLHPDDPVRPVLLEAAAGCRGSDLPAMLRQVRALLPPPAVDGAGSASPAGGQASGEATPSEGHGAGPRCPTAVPGGGQPPAGRRLAAAGAVAAGALVALGAAAALGGGGGTPDIRLGAGPVAVVEGTVVVRWDAPHLELDVGDVRYRYRLAGEVERVAWRDDPRRPTLVVEAGGSRWELPVPVLDRLSGTAAPR